MLSEIELPYLRSRARQLTDDCRALNDLLAQKAEYLAREAEVNRLVSLTNRLMKDALEAQRQEKSEATNSSRSKALGSLMAEGIALTGTVIGKPDRAQTIARALNAKGAAKMASFGTIAVRVGAKGLPEDARVVSISAMARGQHRPESDVIPEIRESGALLVSVEVFAETINRAIAEIRAGRTRLPISFDQVARAASNSGSHSRGPFAMTYVRRTKPVPKTVKYIIKHVKGLPAEKASGEPAENPGNPPDAPPGTA